MPACRSCGKPVEWVNTETGKKMPLDEKPDPSGNIILKNGVAHVLKKDELPPPKSNRYFSHFSTCPNAKSHRKEP